MNIHNELFNNSRLFHLYFNKKLTLRKISIKRLNVNTRALI